MKSLKSILEQKKCFKVICGAGNEDLQEVERLVAVYAKAGCHFFDLSANKEVLKAAKRGLEYSIEEPYRGDYHFCISTGIKGEPHLNKVKILEKKCEKCKKCIKTCPQNAINKKLEVDEKKCVGCLKCLKACKHNAIEIYQKNKLLNLEKLKPDKFSCVELHACGEDEDDVKERWEYINKNFDGFLSLCIDRSKLSDEKLIKRLKKILKKRKPYTTIIQADGAPMSGGEDDYKTTLQAVATAELIQKENFAVYLLISGGTNSKTAELAKLCGVDFNGIAIGSYARKIVKKFIEREDFFTNQDVFEQAVASAKDLYLKLFQDII